MTQVTGQRLIDNLRIILKTCLVDGWGLLTCLRFGVICRKNGFNDVIMADVTPWVE